MTARSFIVPSRWLALDPHHRLSVPFWTGVRDQLSFDKIDPDKASDIQVADAIMKYDAAKQRRERRQP